jgi:hypothetical protein
LQFSLQAVSPETFRYTLVYSVTTQETWTWILTAVKTSNLDASLFNKRKKKSTLVHILFLRPYDAVDAIFGRRPILSQTTWWYPWSRVLLEKLTVTQLVKKFSAFYATRRSITVFTSSCHWPLYCARWIQSTVLRIEYQFVLVYWPLTSSQCWVQECVEFTFMPRIRFHDVVLSTAESRNLFTELLVFVRSPVRGFGIQVYRYYETVWAE